VLIVNGTLIPVHDREVAASSKNHWYSVNVQVVIDANTRLVVAVGDPLSGDRNDCRAFTESGVDQACEGAHVMADGGYWGSPGVIIPYRAPSDGSDLPAWKQRLNKASHKRVGARVEHALVHTKSWNILRDCRRKGRSVGYAASGVALMRNLAMTF
jgi:hypothetical protein